MGPHCSLWATFSTRKSPQITASFVAHLYFLVNMSSDEPQAQAQCHQPGNPLMVDRFPTPTVVHYFSNCWSPKTSPHPQRELPLSWYLICSLHFTFHNISLSINLPFTPLSLLPYATAFTVRYDLIYGTSLHTMRWWELLNFDWLNESLCDRPIFEFKSSMI